MCWARSVHPPPLGAQTLPSSPPRCRHRFLASAAAASACGGAVPPDTAPPTEGKDIMADKDGLKPIEQEVEDEVDVDYKAPEKKTLQEIQELDKNDESLNKYKQALLGAVPTTIDPSTPNIQVTGLTLVCSEAPGPITMDLTGDLGALKNQSYALKEGVDYQVKITFKVNKEIVSGLRYLHNTYRKGIRVDKAVYMVGSYGPRVEEYEFLTPVEEAPKGMLVRGNYRIKSQFTDDDKTDHLSWEWNLNIKKDWKE